MEIEQRAGLPKALERGTLLAHSDAWGHEFQATHDPDMTPAERERLISFAQGMRHAVQLMLKPWRADYGKEGENWKPKPARTTATGMRLRLVADNTKEPKAAPEADPKEHPAPKPKRRTSAKRRKDHDDK